MRLFAFLKKDQPEKGWWFAVIVQVPENETTGVVIDMAARRSRPEIDAYVTGWLSGDRETVYSASPHVVN